MNRLWSGSQSGSVAALLLCLALMGGGCSSSDADNQPMTPDTAAPLIEVQLNARAQDLNNNLVTYPEDNLVGTQHASQVILYLFKGIGESAEYSGRAENIGWSEHFNNKTPEHTASMNYRLQKPLEPNTDYMFLAVGVNTEGVASFDFPLTAMKEQTPGTSLADAVARLKSTLPSSKLRRSELYVGMEPYRPANHSATRITLYRRVAGVGCFLKNIPSTVSSPVTQGVTDTKVASLRLSLYQPQHVAVPLLTRQQKPVFQDFIPEQATDTDRSTILVYQMPEKYNPSDTIEVGSFVLPVPAPADKGTYTLRLELLNAVGQVLQVRRIKLPKDDDLNHGDTGGGTGIIDTESAFRFPIIANHYYGIGSPKKPIDLKGNGADLVITVDPTWKDEPDLELGDKEQK